MERFEANETTTAKIRFAVQFSWDNGKTWVSSRLIEGTFASLDYAKARIARLPKEIAAGHHGRFEGMETLPQTRIVQQVSEWTVIDA